LPLGKIRRETRRVLIYRLGSLGDTVVTLPCFHLIAKTFPNAERRVLTNFPVSGKAPPLGAILEGSGLVHGYLAYPVETRSFIGLWSLRREIMRWRPEVLVYLTLRKEPHKIIRDALFFRLCGIRELVAVPYSKRLRENQVLNGNGLYESEAARLLRALGSSDNTAFQNEANWDLHLTPAERQRAAEILNAWPAKDRFIGCSLGAKVYAKFWGEENWRTVLKQLSTRFPDHGLVLVGAAEEFQMSERVSRRWAGPRLNLCGALTPRESAAILSSALVFLGHDSGPMHLAAAVGAPCAVVFSARAYPGVWFPHGKNHKIIYHQTPCYNCNLDLCPTYKKKCITSIAPEELFGAACELLQTAKVQ